MRRWLTILMLCVAAALPAVAAEQPAFAPQIGTQVDLTVPLADGTGRTEPLGQWLGTRPALVVFGYDNCPNLCGVVQQVVATALGKAGLDADSYVPLFITIAPDEGPEDAAAAKSRLADAAGAEAAAPWRFLTGAGVETLSDEFGIGSIERARIQEYVHPVAVFAVTPDGRIARVLPGLDIQPRDLRLALVEASAGRLGNVIDQVFLFCAGYDPTKGQYTSVVEGGLRIACVAMLVFGLVGLGWLKLRERRA